MTTELQDYRRQKQSGTLDKNVFAGWSRRYRETLGINSVSDADFAEALLADAPLDQDVSDKFWDRLTACSHAEAQVFANEMDKEMSAVASRYGIAPGDADALWNLAVLRPLLDEFTPETERQAFLTKYGDILLEGVPLEHLTVVSPQDDLEGTVPASSLPPRWASSLPPTAHVRLQVMAYRSNIDDDLYGLWKEHKAGRARYEEKLFRTHRLGLTYDQKDPYMYDKDYDDED
uniref:Uncharacterized protein n=1 Tax=Amphora coffeiformis TaxID=265554 RepID=A0A7S3KXM6_9STRA